MAVLIRLFIRGYLIFLYHLTMGVGLPHKIQKITSQVFLSPITIPITWTMVIKKKPYTTIVPKNNSSKVLPNARFSPPFPQRASIIVINAITFKQNTLMCLISAAMIS